MEVVSMKFNIGKSGIRESNNLGCPSGIPDLKSANIIERNN